MEINLKASDIENLLKNHGYKMTHSREIIVKLFVETSDHLRPEDVYQHVREFGVSLPTVYRTVDILKRHGIIKEIVIHKENFYELSIYSQKKLHIHFHCIECGQIKEYNDRQVFREMIKQKEMLERSYLDDIQDITIVMTGVCVECIEKKQN